MVIAAPATTLLVNEIFGPTIQGEGVSIGRPAAFLRLAACNQQCVWCDTRYTWDFKSYDRALEARPLTTIAAAELVHASLPVHERLLVISGGEPMLQQSALVEFLANLRGYCEVEVEVETAGTIAPDVRLVPWVNRFTVSLKLAHSGNPLEVRYRPDVIRRLHDTGKASWKFVAAMESDFDEIDPIVYEFGLDPVYIMPLGTTTYELDARMRVLVGPTIARGYRLTPRLHIDIWQNERAH